MNSQNQNNASVTSNAYFDILNPGAHGIGINGHHSINGTRRKGTLSTICMNILYVLYLYCFVTLFLKSLTTFLFS